MALDAIGLMGIDMEGEHKPFPSPTPIEAIRAEKGTLVTLVDVDFDTYRRAHETRSVHRNVTLPAWLDTKASKAGINVSAILQAPLKQELRL